MNYYELSKEDLVKEIDQGLLEIKFLRELLDMVNKENDNKTKLIMGLIATINKGVEQND